MGGLGLGPWPSTHWHGSTSDFLILNLREAHFHVVQFDCVREGQGWAEDGAHRGKGVTSLPGPCRGEAPPSCVQVGQCRLLGPDTRIPKPRVWAAPWEPASYVHQAPRISTKRVGSLPAEGWLLPAWPQLGPSGRLRPAGQGRCDTFTAWPSLRGARARRLSTASGIRASSRRSWRGLIPELTPLRLLRGQQLRPGLWEA